MAAIRPVCFLLQTLVCQNAWASRGSSAILSDTNSDPNLGSSYSSAAPNRRSLGGSKKRSHWSSNGEFSQNSRNLHKDPLWAFFSVPTSLSSRSLDSQLFSIPQLSLAVSAPKNSSAVGGATAGTDWLQSRLVLQRSQGQQGT